MRTVFKQKHLDDLDDFRCCKVMRELIFRVACTQCFIVLPTTILSGRPHVSGSSVWTSVVR